MTGHGEEPEPTPRPPAESSGTGRGRHRGRRRSRREGPSARGPGPPHHVLGRTRSRDSTVHTARAGREEKHSPSAPLASGLGPGNKRPLAGKNQKYHAHPCVAGRDPGEPSGWPRGPPPPRWTPSPAGGEESGRRGGPVMGGPGKAQPTLFTFCAEKSFQEGRPPSPCREGTLAQGGPSQCHVGAKGELVGGSEFLPCLRLKAARPAVTLTPTGRALGGRFRPLQPLATGLDGPGPCWTLGREPLPTAAPQDTDGHGAIVFPRRQVTPWGPTVTRMWSTIDRNVVLGHVTVFTGKWH